MVGWLFCLFNCTPGKPKKIKENPRLVPVFCFEPLVWTTVWTPFLKGYELYRFLQNYIGYNVLMPLFTIFSFTRTKLSISSQGKIDQWRGDRWNFIFYAIRHRAELILWIITSTTDYSPAEWGNREGFFMAWSILQSLKFGITRGTDCELLHPLHFSWESGLCDLLC